MNTVYIDQVSHLLRLMLLLHDLVMDLTAYFSSVERSVGLAFLDLRSLNQVSYFSHLVKGGSGSLVGHVLRAAIHHALGSGSWHDSTRNEL